jgi:hypothetical protein
MDTFKLTIFDFLLIIWCGIRMGSEAAPSYLPFTLIIYELLLIICVDSAGDIPHTTYAARLVAAVSWRFFLNVPDIF